MEGRTAARHMKPTKMTKQANFHIGSYSSSSSTSPLSGLCMMLPDKMTASISSQSQGDETLSSRDSGHSSGGGTPDLRGQRLRGRASAAAANEWRNAPAMPYRGYQARSTGYFRRSYSPCGKWDSVDRDKTNHIESDAKSICNDGGSLSPTISMNAIQTSGDGPFQEAVKYDTANAFLRKNYSGCKCQRGMSSLSPATSDESMLNFWCPGTESVTRDRMTTPSHLEESASGYKKVNSDHRQGRGGIALSLLRIMTTWYFRLWLLLKIVLASASSSFLILAFLFSYNSWCCKNDRLRSWDLDRLKADLTTNVYGQDRSMCEVVEAIRGFLSTPSPVVSVLVFEGFAGSGKTFVSSIIRSAFPVAKNIHVFSVPLHFSSETSIGYLDDLSLNIRRSCGHSLVIFDDTYGASRSTTDAIERFILSLSDINAEDLKRSKGTLVLMLTNAGSAALKEHILSRRDTILVDDAVEVILAAAGKQPPSRLVAVAEAEKVSVRLVPFLPLTRDHVKQCVLREVMRQGLMGSDDLVEMIVSDMEFYHNPESDQVVLSEDGCKQVASKVDYYLGGHLPFLGDSR